MFRWKLLLVLMWALISAVAMTGAQTTGFDPRLTLLGVTEQVQVGQSVQWMLTASNVGTAAGDDVALTIVFSSGLRIDAVQSAGETTQDGRTVTVRLGDLATGANVRLTVLTTVLDASAVSAQTCVSAANFSDTVCATAVPVQSLPATGETPFWRRPFLLIGVLTISGSLLLIGFGLLGLQNLQNS